MIEAITNFDIAVLDFIYEKLHCAFLDKLMPLITSLGDAGIFWIVLAVFLICTKQYRRTGIMMGVALVFGLLVGNLTLKPLIARIRPYEVNNAVELIVDRLSDYSFPSGHTLASFEGATVLMLRDKQLGIPALVLAFLIALSRLYLYVHYPTDIICGIILGVLFGIIAYHLVNSMSRSRRKKTR